MYSELIAPKAAALYCRLSYAPDGSLEKVETQEDRGRELAERLGWSVCCVYRDNSKSAWQKNRKRPAWDAMLPTLAPAADHQHDGLLTYHGDRLMRQPYDLELLLRIAEDQRIPLASVSGVRDLSSADDRFILRIEVAAACRESDNISRRVRDRQRTRREKLGLTQVGGDNRPYGYGVQVGTKTKVHAVTGEETQVPVYDTTKQVKKEARYLLQAAKRLLAGQSQGSVLRWLDTKGETTTGGSSWIGRGQTLRNLLTAPRIAGLIEHEGTLYEAAWDGILPRDMWEQLRATYAQQSKEHGWPGRERRHLLTGPAGAECSECGTFLTTKPTGGRNRPTSRIYFCKECRKVGRSKDHLERYVEARTLVLLNSRPLLDELQAGAEDPDAAEELADLERRKRETEKQLEELAEFEDVDPVLAMRSVASFGRKITALRERLAASSRQRLVARMVGYTQEQWEDEPMDNRAAVVRALWRVVVYPTTRRGPGFDTAAVKLTRRPLAASEEDE